MAWPEWAAANLRLSGCFSVCPLSSRQPLPRRCRWPGKAWEPPGNPRTLEPGRSHVHRAVDVECTSLTNAVTLTAPAPHRTNGHQGPTSPSGCPVASLCSPSAAPLAKSLREQPGSPRDAGPLPPRCGPSPGPQPHGCRVRALPVWFGARGAQQRGEHPTNPLQGQEWPHPPQTQARARVGDTVSLQATVGKALSPRAAGQLLPMPLWPLGSSRPLGSEMAPAALRPPQGAWATSPPLGLPDLTHHHNQPRSGKIQIPPVYPRPTESDLPGGPGAPR